MFLTLLVPAGPTLIQTMCYSLHFCPVWEFLESKRHGSCAIPLPGPQYPAWATWRDVFREPAWSLLESFSIQQCMHLISCLLVFSLSLDMFVRNLRRLHVLWPPRLLKPWNNCHNFVLFFFFLLFLKKPPKKCLTFSVLNPKPFSFQGKVRTDIQEWGACLIHDYKTWFVMKNRCYSRA